MLPLRFYTPLNLLKTAKVLRAGFLRSVISRLGISSTELYPNNDRLSIKKINRFYNLLIKRDFLYKNGVIFRRTFLRAA